MEPFLECRYPEHSGVGVLQQVVVEAEATVDRVVVAELVLA